MPLDIIEGKWEDVVKQSSRLQGRQVHVTVLDEEWKNHLIPNDDAWNNMLRFIHTELAPHMPTAPIPDSALSREQMYD